jgi:hypothetical protein
VYEAGPCGFVIWRHLTAQGPDRDVVAPSSIPKRAGLRVARCDSAHDIARKSPVMIEWAAEDFPAPARGSCGSQKSGAHYVQHEFEAYLKCGRLEQDFLRLRCASCHAEHLLAFSCKRRGSCPSCGARRMAETAALLVDEIFPQAPVRQWALSVPYPLRFLFACRPAIMGAVLGVVYRLIARHLIQKAGFSSRTASAGAVTLIQRFGGALNLNLHFHMPLLDGVYVEHPDGAVRFRWVPAPTSAELTALVQRIAQRVGRFLQRRGLLEQDAENAYLAGGEADEDPMVSLFAPSITYRIAVGPQAGRQVFTLQTLPAYEEPCADGVGKVAGFSLHAGVAARADERHKLERLCRYISRPVVSEQRLSLTPGGHVRYQLKTPHKNGTTHVLFEPLDCVARLAALVPKPRVKRTRYHGVSAPNSRYRARLTQAGRGKGATGQAPTEDRTRGPAPGRDELGTTPQTGVAHRHRNLRGLRRGDAHHRVHRRAGGDREDPRSSGRESCRGAAGTTAAMPGTARGARWVSSPPLCDWHCCPAEKGGRPAA